MNTKLHPIAFLFFLLSLPLFSQAQQSDAGKINSKLNQQQNTFTFSTDKAKVMLEFCTADMIRVRTTWSGAFENEESYMLTGTNWAPIKVEVKKKSKYFELSTDKLLVRLNKSPYSIEIFNREGDLLSSEVVAEAAGGAYKADKVVGTRKKLMPDEHFFGFGERMDFTDQLGKEVNLNVGRGTKRPHIIGAYNIMEANYAPVPFFMSTRGYGIFLHNPYATRWDMGNSRSDSYAFEAANGELDYYFIYGPNFPAILNHYTNLTGKAPLLPRFAHGLHVGTYSGGTWGHTEHSSTDYVVELARKYRAMGIPVDILHLDSTWRMFGKSGGNGATSYEWRETMKDPKGMFDQLYAMNLNMVGLHIRSRFDNGTQLNLLDQAREQGMVYPDENKPGEFVNFFDEKAIDWWWDNAVMRIASIGAKFLKTDEGSAFGRVPNDNVKVGPVGERAQRLHNIFPLMYAKAPYERFSKYNNMRGMNHTREGYAGIQRYPFIWAGDWPSEWQYFGPVMKAGINMGLSGVSYWTHNMGGFEHKADPELYIRWVQFGMFSPVAHVFGMDHPGYKEPWNYGDEALANFTKYDKLRYRLIPYIYSSAFKTYQTGVPLMRALVMENQHDVNTYAVDDQYMFGDNMLICPVTTKEAKTRVVYLPEGEWVEYWTGERFTGKKHYNVVAPLDQLPIFVKAGAIIPMQDEVQYDDRKAWGDITFDIFPGGKSSFDLYEDDGLSEEYKQGNFSITTVSAETVANGTTIKVGAAAGKHQVPTRNYILKIHQDKAPTGIQAGSKNLATTTAAGFAEAGTEGWYYDQEAKLLWVKSKKVANEELAFNISY
ncbi:glycoside hydrolase family 31 protein [Pontibacter beigongshangensis]|uniref:glycoside hydrolase family 31 protein n=1 Tax=Pontibacter beigongshangensis TaxID=2574733 RepID=UPI0016507BB8|nr:TIM-barrel domain-containing protein [Pontibacter beigongshangensis]